jgi:hypothetical protein
MVVIEKGGRREIIDSSALDMRTYKLSGIQKSRVLTLRNLPPGETDQTRKPEQQHVSWCALEPPHGDD